MKSSRLTNNVIPSHYDLFFKPNFKDFTFQGNETIQINIKSPTSSIILHSSDLKIKKAELKSNNQTLTPKIKLNKKEDSLILSLPKKIKGNISLYIEFQGILNDNLSGFYRSKYTYKNKDYYLATTQFEAPYARQAFPCFDEPDKKATFSLALEIPKNLKAISNMPIIKEENQNNNSLIKFDKTPLMSTYLLYFGIGDFEFVESNLDKIKIRVVTTIGKSQQGLFALDLTKKFLKYFQDYSKVPYPLPKLDLIAIPDFSAGAMENWGAITFREIALLFDEKNTSTRVKKRIAEIIAHELWHQWSGNLVTMDWWNDLWLNESFATYMAYKAVDFYFPDWKMWEDFVSGSTCEALTADMLKTTHPIEVKVNSPNEIEEIFDAISYSKGGSILRMIDSYLTPEVFQKGIQNYLKKYQYKNTIASDLWNELAKVSNAPIKQIMESWIKQPGFPLIKVKQKNNSLILEQERFNAKTNQFWQIPIIIQTTGKEIRTLLTKKSQEIPLPANVKLIKLNKESEGFYRTQYTNEHLNKIKPDISQNKLSVLDKTEIQNDLFNLTLINKTPINNYLDFLKSYENEKSLAVLQDIYSNLYSTYFIFSQEPYWNQIWPKYKDIMKKPFKNSLNKLGWNPKENESQEDALLRALSIGYLSFSEDPTVISKGLELFKNPESLHPDIKGSIYALAAKNNGESTFKTLLNHYEKTQSPEDKVKILSAMCKFKDEKILKSSLDFALTDKVRAQDLRTVFANINSNPNLRPLFLNWTKNNWNKLSKYQKTHFVFMGLLEAMITSYTGKQKEEEIRSFLKQKKVAYKKTQANAFETMRLNTNWLNNNSKILEDYFK